MPSCTSRSPRLAGVDVTLASITSATASTVTVDGGAITITHLVIPHPEAATLAAAAQEQGGHFALEDLIRRALPVGMVALSMGSAAVDTGSLQRTLDTFATAVDQRSTQAIDGLNATLDRLREGEVAVTTAARSVLATLPDQIQAVLGGQAENVRSSVAEAARTVQAAGLAQMQSALAQHSTAVRNALLLDHEGPVQQLRHDVLGQLDSTRRELTDQLSAVRGLLQAAEAHKAGASTSTRALGQAWERTAMDGLARDVVERAGDLYEATGSTPAPGGTSRAGDGVATLSRAVTGHGRPVRLLLEAKTRSRPLSAKAWRQELSTSTALRECHGALALVPTAAEVPGGGPFSRVGQHEYVVACDDPETVTLVYLVLREIVALLAVRHDGGNKVDLAKAEAQVTQALTSLGELDEVARLASTAGRNLNQIFEVAKRTKEKVQQALTDSLATLHG